MLTTVAGVLAFSSDSEADFIFFFATMSVATLLGSKCTTGASSVCTIGRNFSSFGFGATVTCFGALAVWTPAACCTVDRASTIVATGVFLKVWAFFPTILSTPPHRSLSGFGAGTTAFAAGGVGVP